ncbi:MAG TPA: ankyrin repeat domain-containing protein [Sphingomicrobium sp.]|nr:ankyrin repeat domain-containing protein [Sphingomicrobium sp.]
MGRIAAVVLGIALAATPAVAQYVSDAEPFIAAVAERDGAKAMQLVEARPSVVNARNGKGETALIVAIARSDDMWTRFLLSKGADPNLAERDGNTPLITAARVGYLDAADLLLRRGAKVDATNRMGETALIVAVQVRQLPIVKLLLAKGADPHRTDSAQGYSALDYARRDPRAREVLAAIEASIRKPPAKSDKLDDFKL